MRLSNALRARAGADGESAAAGQIAERFVAALEVYPALIPSLTARFIGTSTTDNRPDMAAERQQLTMAAQVFLYLQW